MGRPTSSSLVVHYQAVKRVCDTSTGRAEGGAKWSVTYRELRSAPIVG
jgi:hypothetical protein